MQIWTLVNSMKVYWDLRLDQLFDETLPNFIKKKAPKKGRERNKRFVPKSRQANSPKEVGHQEEREQLRMEP
jgi:hypothetical protein